MNDQTEHDLLYRHGLPEDVIDGVLCLHAQELAALQRADRTELRKRIASAARTVKLRLGPNAVAMAQRGEPIILNMNEADALADAVLAALPAPDQQTAVRAAVFSDLIAKAEEWDGHITVQELRRLAGEAQQDEAHPPQHTWRVETRDPLANQWAAGSHFASRPHAVERYNTANRHAPLWNDGTAVERRIVRETTTYTVEQPDTANEARP